MPLSEHKNTYGRSILIVLVLTAVYILFKTLFAALGVHFMPNLSLTHTDLYIETGEITSTAITLLLLAVYRYKVDCLFTSNKSPISSVVMPLVTVVACLASVQVWYVIKHGSLIYINLSGDPLQTSINFANVARLLELLRLVVLQPLFEELFFTATLLPILLRGNLSAVLAVLITSALFAITHLDLYSFGYHMLFHIVACLLFLSSHRVIYSIAYHSLANLIWLGLSMYWLVPTCK